MPGFTIRIGMLLVVLGAAGYVMTGAASVTALIPSVVGAALVLCGAVARRGGAVGSVALRVALVVAGVGLFGTVRALAVVPAALMGTGGPARPALIARASMALILLVYVAVSARALVRDALRRSRR